MRLDGSGPKHKSNGNESLLGVDGGKEFEIAARPLPEDAAGLNGADCTSHTNQTGQYDGSRLRGVLALLRRDAARYTELGGWHRCLGFYVGATHRFGFWAFSLRSDALRAPIQITYRATKLFWRLLVNVQIAQKARIGPGLCLVHPFDIMIPATSIGDDCLIFHDVTVGTTPVIPGVPKIGNHVNIYVGACILGGIVIGDDAKIGAHCVISRNVPPGSVVLPPPTRVVPAGFARAFDSRMREGGLHGGGSDPGRKRSDASGAKKHEEAERKPTFSGAPVLDSQCAEMEIPADGHDAMAAAAITLPDP